MDMGVICEGAYCPPVVRPLAEALDEEAADVLSGDLLAALNRWRQERQLPALCCTDPVSLRLLGVPCGGDELFLLARYAGTVKGSEVGKFDACLRLLRNGKRGLCLCEPALLTAADVRAATAAWTVFTSAEKERTGV